MHNKIEFNSKNMRLSSKGYWIYSPISILAFPISVSVVNPSISIVWLFFYGVLITVAAFFLYFILIYLTKIKDSENVTNKVAFFVLIPIITGAFRGYIFYHLVYHLNLNQPSNLSNRIISSIFTTFFWLSIANYVVNISINFKNDYRVALNQYLTNHPSSNPNISAENEIQLQNLQSSLKNSVGKFLDKKGAGNFKEIASSLTNQIN